LRFNGHVVRSAGVGTDPCGLAYNDVLDAIEEGRVDAVALAIDAETSGLTPGTRLRIESRVGDGVEVWVGRSAPVGGRTYVRRGDRIWAVRGDLRAAMDAVAAHCERGG